jgi:hypothetical protein
MNPTRRGHRPPAQRGRLREYMPYQNAARATSASAGRDPQTDRLARAINQTHITVSVSTVTFLDEAILDGDALALFTSVHDLCGTGVVRDRAWWAAEAARCGTDWPRVLATIAAALDLCQPRQAPIPRGGT